MAADLICQACVHERHGIWCESGECECCGVLVKQAEDRARDVAMMESRMRGYG